MKCSLWYNLTEKLLRESKLRGKSTDALMRHIRDEHDIDIKGSSDKKKLREMGYYHGYKAYRFHNTKENKIKYDKFEQVISVYNFDCELKSILYPYVMKLETTLKNIVIDNLVTKDTVTFEKIYDNKLTKYREMQQGTDQYSREMSKRLKLKKDFARAISDSYGKNPIVEHFVHSEKPLPLWAHLELIMLGTFGNFVSCLNTAKKLEIANEIGTYHSGIDTDGSMLEKHIYIIKELRNAIAHNSIVFDTRFSKESKIAKKVKRQLRTEFNINNIEFRTILDYICLLLHYFKPLGMQKLEMKKLVRETRKSIEEFDTNLNDKTLLFTIVRSDYLEKLKLMDEFISK